MATPSALHTAIARVLPNFGITSLKDEQLLIIECLVNGSDCVAILPTGFGKSLPFQIVIPVKHEMVKLEKYVKKNIGKIVVCCPLVALMQDQVEKLQAIPNVTAAYKGSSAETDKQIEEGLIDIIYASPETLVGDPLWRESLQKLNVQTIVIDEFHTIATWGEDDEGTQKQAFRKWFGQIGELRSLFPNANVLALSATCTKKISKRVKKQLNLKDNILEIIKSPNKENIKLVSSKISNNIEMSMSWLVDGFDEMKDNFPRVLIYCISINDASKLYLYLIQELPEFRSFIEMYHSETEICKKKEIVDKLKDPDSTLKIIISTSALGMGVDTKNFHNVILYGAQKNCVELVQEIGRAGRDDLPSVCLILYTSHHSRFIDAEIKKVLNTTDCRRLAVMGNFIKDNELQMLKDKCYSKHSCCDLCTKRCNCGECQMLTLERIFQSIPIDDDTDSEATEMYNLSDYEIEIADFE